MFEKIGSFLQNQKQRMLDLDEKAGMLDRERRGFDFPNSRQILYENTINWLMSPKNRLGILGSETQILSHPGVISEDTLSTSIATFTTALLPAVRRIYSQMIGMELVSLQPLKGPTGKIYWIDHTFGTAVNTNQPTAGDRMDNVRYRTYGDGSEQGSMRDVNFSLTSKDISTVEKKLRAKWTLEAEQDLSSQWGLDLESELVPEVANEIIREVDGMIIYALYNGAGAGNVNWNTTGYLAGDTTSTDQKAYKQTLFEAIVEADWLIYAARYMHADWIVCGTTFASRLEKLDEYKSTRGTTPNELQVGRYLIGTVDNRWKVYIDPWTMPANVALLGTRGTSWKEAVAYYSPYIPLFTSDKYIVNDDFTQQQRGVMSRFAYGVIPETSTQSPVKSNGLATVTLTTS
jgi:hypothetical protein